MKRFMLPISILAFMVALNAYAAIPCDSYQMLEPLVAEGANPGRLSPDGLSFICGLKDAKRTSEREMLFEWRRANLDEPWQGPFLLEGKINELSGSADNMQPTISDDGLLLVFVRNETGSWEDNDLWLATRSSPDAPFDMIRAIDELNTSVAEAYPFITSDGKKLYYITDDGLMVAEFSRKKGEFKNADLMALPEEITPMSAWVSSDELEFVISDGSVLFHLSRQSAKKDLGDFEKVELPDDLGFVSSPSFDHAGNLYLYESLTYEADYEENWIEDEVNLEFLEDDELDESDTDYESSSLTRIIVLGCTGGD